VRFLYYDSIINIEKGKEITGVKTFSLSEEFFRGHFSKRASIPGIIFVEAMAQLLGWLIIYSNDFNLTAVLSVVEGARVPVNIRPGIIVEIRGTIVSTSERDSMGRASVYHNGIEIAGIKRILYSHFHKTNQDELIKRFCYYSGFSPGEIARKVT
jgi:3-hydroxyacyl-[acyl-carrier-protein] dehydratase